MEGLGVMQGICRVGGRYWAVLSVGSGADSMSETGSYPGGRFGLRGLVNHGSTVQGSKTVSRGIWGGRGAALFSLWERRDATVRVGYQRAR
eukprot:2772286-Rhodomonas_salina.1